MRRWTALPLVLCLAGCLTPGERDPTRYPGDRLLAQAPHPELPPHPMLQAIGGIAPAPQPRAAASSGPMFCIVALQPAVSGITLSGAAPPVPICPAPPPAKPPNDRMQ